MTEKTEIGSIIYDEENRGKSYDEQCKKVLCNKQILAHILKTCTSEYQNEKVEDIPKYIDELNNMNLNYSSRINGLNTDDTRVNEALIKYDVLFKASIPHSNKKIGLIINIEAQNKENPGYNLVSRAIYYCSRLLARQKNEEFGFKNSNYDELKKVYSIWICMRPSKKKEDSITTYSIHEECIQNEAHCPKEIYDLMTVVMLYPKKEYNFEDEKTGLLEMLTLLFTSLLPVEEKASKLESDYGILLTKEEEQEVEVMCNLSQGVFDDGRYEATVQYILNLCVIQKMKPQEALEFLGVPIEDRPHILKLYNHRLKQMQAKEAVSD